ncbi:hypothetical protein GCM10011504_00220 [Siccirubricoccus deserti]|nr:hypothetical protein GCM10011504_00220 [Siccirubricoccus deserti]
MDEKQLAWRIVAGRTRQWWCLSGLQNSPLHIRDARRHELHAAAKDHGKQWHEEEGYAQHGAIRLPCSRSSIVPPPDIRLRSMRAKSAWISGT